MTEPNNHPEARLALFQSREIRRVLHNDEWWFVITDIAAALMYAADPSDYWKKMRRRDPDLGLDSQRGGQIDPPLAWRRGCCWGMRQSAPAASWAVGLGAF
jgi:hypothetical protein